MAEQKPIIGITNGDVNGIGLEIILKTLSDTRIMEFCTPVIYSSARVVSFHRKACNLGALNYAQNTSLDNLQPNTINIINCWDEEVAVQLGIDNAIGGMYAFKSLNACTFDWVENNIQGMVTAPINKHNMPAEDFKFKGHTEYLASKTEGEPLMIMCSDELKVGLVSGHVSVVSSLPINPLSPLCGFKPSTAIFGLSIPKSFCNDSFSDCSFFRIISFFTLPAISLTGT